MDVEALAKGLYHVLIARQMGDDTQFYLTVVGREEKTTGLGDEAFAYFLAVIVTHGHVLQVGIARREAPRGRDGLVERGVDMARARADELGKSVDIGAEQLLKSAIIEYLGDDGALLTQLLQHLLRRDILARFGLLGLFYDLHFEIGRASCRERV